MSGEFDSRKDSQSTKFERRPQIFVKLSFRESCDSKSSGLHAFENMVINLPVKILKLLKNDISGQLHGIFNMSFSTGKFPSVLKIAKHKKVI